VYGNAVRPYGMTGSESLYPCAQCPRFHKACTKAYGKNRIGRNMKLYTKVIISMVFRLVVVVIAIQAFQGYNVRQKIGRFTKNNLQVLREREEANALDLWL
jgi:hypothetical protein